MSSGSGSGVGKGGGTGGAIRDAGGKFGEMEAAQENAYFKKLVNLKIFFINVKISKFILNKKCF